ncbi:MAG: hypothetical protein AB203_00290 [Parcubacteria bacterium C7867-008]|nr:MAG: hypothetical protein AB203_00290 [Parcubacteria bacterium C7867-008]
MEKVGSAPKPGDTIYLDTELYVSHGVDDVIGGKAVIKEVLQAYGAIFITTELDPLAQYRWENGLELEQERLKQKFGDSWAHFEPDLRPEFND